MDGAPGPFLDGLVGTIITILRGGYDRLSDGLYDLFSLLAGLNLMLAAVGWVANHMQVFMGFLWSLLHLFFWAWLFFSFAFITQAFIDYCVWGGLEIGGVVSGGQLTPEEFQRPSTLIDKGFVAVTPIKDFIQSHTGWGALFNLPNLLLLLGVWVVVQTAFIVMALYLSFAQIMLYLVTAFMFLFLIFGVLSGVSFLAERAIGLFIASAARLGVAALMTSILFPFIESFFIPAADQAAANPDMVRIIWLAVGVCFMTGLIILAPAITHSFFAGGPVLSLSNVVPGVALVRGFRRAA